jgi:hypothetical protein
MEIEDSVRSGPTGRAVIAAGSLLFAMLAACSGGVIGHIDVDQKIPVSTVNGSVVSGVLPPSFAPIALDVTNESAYKQGDYDYVKSIQLDRLVLTVTASSEDMSSDPLEDGRPDNFDFFTAIEVHILARIDGADSAALIASIPLGNPQLSNANRQIGFQMTGVDILPYVEAAGGYQIQIRASGSLPPDNVSFDGNAYYRVGVGFF